MGFFKSKKGSIISDYFKSTQKQIGLSVGEACDIAIYDDHIEFEGSISKSKARLSLAQITDIYYGIETEIVLKNKSTIGRAVAGGLIFGSIGAVVGAASGVSPKQKKENHFVFIISYTAADGSDAFLQFEDTRLYKGAKVAKKLKELCNLNQPPVEEIIL